LDNFPDRTAKFKAARHVAARVRWHPRPGLAGRDSCGRRRFHCCNFRCRAGPRLFLVRRDFDSVFRPCC